MCFLFFLLFFLFFLFPFPVQSAIEQMIKQHSHSQTDSAADPDSDSASVLSRFPSAHSQSHFHSTRTRPRTHRSPSHTRQHQQQQHSDSEFSSLASSSSSSSSLCVVGVNVSIHSLPSFVSLTRLFPLSFAVSSHGPVSSLFSPAFESALANLRFPYKLEFSPVDRHSAVISPAVSRPPDEALDYECFRNFIKFNFNGSEAHSQSKSNSASNSKSDSDSASDSFDSFSAFFSRFYSPEFSRLSTAVREIRPINFLHKLASRIRENKGKVEAIELSVAPGASRAVANFLRRSTHLPVKKVSIVASSTLAVSFLPRSSVFSLSDYYFLCYDYRVLFVDLPVEFEVSNYFARQIIHSGYAATGKSIENPLKQLGLNGSGVIISVGDTGVDHSNCYFHDPKHRLVENEMMENHRKILYYSTKFNKILPDSSGHGTHTSGSIGGSWLDCCYSNEQIHIHPNLESFNGLASHSRLAIFDFNDGSNARSIKPPRDIYSEYFLKSYELGARLSSNSWTAKRENRQEFYIREDREIDRFMWDQPDFLAVFAAGNFGARGLQSIVSPGTSKNSLTIGSTINSIFSVSGIEQCLSNASSPLADSVWPRYVSRFSSRGPTLDGRIKPDVVAPGELINSARAANNSLQCPVSCDESLTHLFGTSMATALASGSAALLQQYFLDGFYPSGQRNRSNSFQPSGALVKAAIIHSADNQLVDQFVFDDQFIEIPNSPSYRWGFGRIQLTNVIPIPDQAGKKKFNLFVFNSSAADSMRSFGLFHRCFRVSSAGEFRVTLAWTDRPPSPHSSIALVNDLDLAVSYFDTSGRKRFLTGNLRIDSSASDSGDGQAEFDELNNVEQITIEREKLGENTIVAVHVHGSHVIEAQPFALVATGNFEAAVEEQRNAIECDELVCPNNCGGVDRGICSNEGICRCVPGFGGVDCSLSSQLLIGGRTESLELPLGEFRFFRFSCEFPASLIRIEIRPSTVRPLISTRELPNWIAHENFDTISIDENNDTGIYELHTNANTNKGNRSTNDSQNQHQSQSQSVDPHLSPPAAKIIFLSIFSVCCNSMARVNITLTELQSNNKMKQ